MKNLNPTPENSRRSGVIGLGLIPGRRPAVISIRVSHGHNQYEVDVVPDSSFGYLKSIISQNLGLKPEICKLIFGGVEKQDDESLQIAGVRNNSKVLLVEDMECRQQVAEEASETPAASKGEDAVAKVRKEVDKLEQQVSALQAIIDCGKKVDNKEIVYLTEMLMRQLLKLDGIEAEGEGRVQRKNEVRRVQIIVETLDTLKSRNSNSSNNTQRNRSVASGWKASEPSPSSPSPTPSPTSATPVVRFSTCPVPYHTPSDIPQHTYSDVPHILPSTHPYFIPYSHHPSQMAHFPTYTVPYDDGSSYMPHRFSMP